MSVNPIKLNIKAPVDSALLSPEAVLVRAALGRGDRVRVGVH